MGDNGDGGDDVVTMIDDVVGDDVGPRLTVGGGEGDDEWVTVGGNDTVGGDVLAIRGSKHSPHSSHTSLA